MIGIVIVSHSTGLAEGVAELAREMGGPTLAIEPAGGLDDGAIGTDAARVMAAVDKVRSDDGVLILMDLGSALMSAEMAVEMLEPGGPVVLSAAPLVEGAVAAAARARSGATLEEVAAEARGALAMKTAQLGEDDATVEDAADASESEGEEERIVVTNRLGLHARPAARFVATAGEHDARVTVRNLTRGTGPADARSLTALATLSVRSGDEIAVTAAGPQARAALDALLALAADNFGDPPETTLDQPQKSARPLSEGAPPTLDQPQRGVRHVEEGARLRGVAASPGVALGPARRLSAPEVEVAEAPAGDPDAERARLDGARAAVRADLEVAKAALAERGAAGEAEIFTAHALLLDDAALMDPTARRIEAGESAGRAWQAAAADAAAAFRALDDPYLRERAVDVEDVGRQVLAQLAGTTAAPVLAEPGIVIADELTPGEAAALDPERAQAIATARGGATGHAAIVAGALGIPAVVGLGPAILAVANGTPLALDGSAGTVDVAPDAATTAALTAQRDAAAAKRAMQLARAAEPAVLPDGRRIDVFANVGSPAEARQAVVQGAEGVGLLRTEFLFLDRATPPDEEEQVAVLREIAEAFDGRPVIVRTLDAGADKPLPFLRQEPEDNPFLGLRGLRLSLAEPALFRTQLRAILRVAAEHPLAVMFPMVATLGELRAARAALEAARAELGTDAPLDVGVMVEVPALALQAADFAPEVDFFSVGTNDLSQYTMAAERGNAALAGLLEDAREPVLTLIARVVEAADNAGRWVGVCGELAGEPEAAVRLAELGVRELSMAAARIPAVKAALRDGGPGAR